MLESRIHPTEVGFRCVDRLSKRYQALDASIRSEGIREPLTIRTKQGFWEVIDGYEQSSSFLPAVNKALNGPHEMIRRQGWDNININGQLAYLREGITIRWVKGQWVIRHPTLIINNSGTLLELMMIVEAVLR